MSASGVITALTIASPHLLYAFIWFRPDLWRRVFSERSVEVFARFAAAGKVLQFTAALLWLYTAEKSSETLSSTSVPKWLWLPSMAGIIAGQVLNVGIYRAIGRDGVYYGFKLGKRVPWHTGFPFNLGISHPQYVGSVLTVWGVGSLLWSRAPPGFGLLLAYWTALYALTALQEQYF